MTNSKIDLARTALVTIDLQDDILATPALANTAASVLAVNNQLAARFRNTAALIALVGVNVAAVRQLGGPAALTADVTVSSPIHLSMDIARDGTARNVVRITKHNPGAFFGTDLDLKLRRSGVDTIILTGVSTSNGVYATALDAYQQGYRLVTVADGCADRDAENHDFFVRKILPRVGEVTTAADVLSRLA